MKSLVLAALLLVGCAQPAPFFPKPAEPAPLAAAVPAGKAEPTATPAPRAGAAGDIRPVGVRKDEPCAACSWSATEWISALVAAVLAAWALVRLYRRKAGVGEETKD